MKPTIQIVAEKSNVSVSTVSRVINNHPAVLPETRQKVLEVINELGYRPNQMARSLPSKGFNAILLVATKSASQAANNPYFGNIINAIGSVAEQHGFELILHSGQSEGSEIEKTLSMVNSRFIKGVVLLSSRINSVFINEIAKTEIPIVVIGRYDSGITAKNVISVDTNNYDDCRKVAHYLCEMGHRDIGCIHAPLSHYVALDRVNGFKKGLSECNVEITDPFFVDGGHTVESAYEAALNLLCARKPTAVFATDDVKALGIYKAAKALGLKIPQDISVIGHNDFDFAPLISPPLSTVRVPIYELGMVSASKLFQMIQNSNEESQLLPTELINRGSVLKI